MADYDLTPRMAPNLDRHLVFPLLEFLQERQLYDDDHILKAKIDLLNNTNMVDYAMDIHKSLYHTEDVPHDMVERRAEVVARLKSLEEAAAPLVSFLQNAAAVQELRADKQYNLQMLNDRYQVWSKITISLHMPWDDNWVLRMALISGVWIRIESKLIRLFLVVIGKLWLVVVG